MASRDRLKNCSGINPTRRAVLFGTCAFVGCGLALNVKQAFATGIQSEHQQVHLGFAGDRIVQLLVEETDIIRDPRVEVKATDRIAWSPNSGKRFGGLGTLNGIRGNFSGKRNTTTPQLFQAWPKVGSAFTAFQAGSAPNGNGALCDQPSVWQVWINGQSVAINTIYRKSVPIQSAYTSERGIAHRKRHLLSFLLAASVPLDAEINIAGPVPDVINGLRKPGSVSEAIHICQVGYPLIGSKKGYIGLWLGHDATGKAGNTDDMLGQDVIWRLVDQSSGITVLDGVLKQAKAGDEPHMKGLNFNGCDIYEADFSAVAAPATYRLEIDGIGASVPFQITDNPYAPVLRAAARWYYHQRSGCPIEQPYGEGRTRARNGHPEDGLTVWQTDVKLGRTSEGFSGGPNAMKLVSAQPIDTASLTNPNAWGGWHDAGDWDRRIQHMDAVYQMANIIELFASARTLDLNIPESGKTFADQAIRARKSETDRGDHVTVLPDLIHEALWGISLWRRTQGAAGGIIGGVEYSLDGIHGSVSWNPVQDAYAYAEEEWAAYHFAHAAAKLGHVIKSVCGDAVLGEALIAEADLAWAWAENQWQSGSSDAGDKLDEKGRFWITSVQVASAAVLYRANGNQNARQIFEENNGFDAQSVKPVIELRRSVYSHASLDYFTAWQEGRDCSPSIVLEILRWSWRKLRREKRMGADYGLHNTDQYPWGRGWMRFGPGSNWRARDLALEYTVNNRNTAPLRDKLIEGMWFGLGCNPSNTCFVQGLGVRQFSDAFAADLIGQDPVPGHISFGVAGGALNSWEKRKTAGAIYPAQQKDWPRYAQIFESSMVVICAEHGIKSNTMEWLFASAFVNEACMSS